ncbi:MAG TPA: dynamin family protein [Burkholderiales bacterium]|nr:dynamin family protein [Burkholderiales bacterium]
MAALNKNQQSRVLTTLTYVDELLSDIARILDAVQNQSPLSKYIANATPVQQKVITDYTARARTLMRSLLEEQRVALPQPTVDAVWAARVALRAAEIAIEELEPQYMHGYGELSEEGRKALNRMVSQLIELLDQMESYLSQGGAGELRARLQRLEAATDEARLLAELERIITAHGLVEFRATLEMLVERMESHTLEVAVFGRVNSGKSSLLNHILKTDVLPIGITPVTAIPLRIVFGPKRWGRAWFVDAAPESFDLGRLSEFAAEQYNPSNMRHVTRINVELPVSMLKEGVTFSDTPGLGSFAAAGANESLAFLPRCDLAIVLVDAASLLTPEDVRLTNALYRSGASVMVLLSKADLLSAEDRWKAQSYVQCELETRLGLEIPVHLVSVKNGDIALCDQWMNEVLFPGLRDHGKLARLSIRQKLWMLRDAIIAALDRRLSTALQTASDDWPQRRQEANRVLSEAYAQLDVARGHRPDNFKELGDTVGEILVEAAHNAGVLCKQTDEPSSDITALVLASLHSRANLEATTVARDLMQLRASLCNALASASKAAGVAPILDEDLPRPIAMPAMNGAAFIPRIIVRRPLLGFPSARIFAYSIRRQLRKRATAAQLSSALIEFGKKLDGWRWEMLDSMRHHFVAKSDLIRAQLPGAEIPGPDLSASRAATIQIDLSSLKKFEPSEMSETTINDMVF